MWSQVRLRDEQTAWVAEGTSEEYFLDVRLAAQTSSVVVSDGGTLQPGVYWLQVNSPESAERGNNPFNHIMVVGTANLTMKYGIGRVLIWATDVQTGAPIPNAPITVYDRDYAALGAITQRSAPGLPTLTACCNCRSRARLTCISHCSRCCKATRSSGWASPNGRAESRDMSSDSSPITARNRTISILQPATVQYLSVYGSPDLPTGAAGLLPGCGTSAK